MTGRLNRESSLFPQAMLLRLLDHETAQAQRHNNALTILRLSLVPDSPLEPELSRTVSQMLSQIFNSQLRAIDLPGHLEGDYVVVLPLTSETGARAVGNRLVRAVAGLHLPYPAQNVSLALCIGLAHHGGGPECDGNVLADQAGVALQEALRQGVHSVVSYSELGGENL